MRPNVALTTAANNRTKRRSCTYKIGNGKVKPPCGTNQEVARVVSF